MARVFASLLLTLGVLGDYIGPTGYWQHGNTWTGTCATGVDQSPIDIQAENAKIEFQANKTFRFLQLSYTPDLVQGRMVGPDFVLYGDFGSIASLDDGYNEYFHASVDKVVFKAPAEHQVNSTVFDLEMQIFHRFAGAESQILVLSILYQISDTDSDFQSTVIASATGEQEIDLRQAFEWVQELFNYYQYSGSLTSPPCDENVIWLIWAEPRPIGREQAAFFATMWQGNLKFAGGNGNNRELQSLGSRVVTRYQGIVPDIGTAATLAIGWLLVVWTGV